MKTMKTFKENSEQVCVVLLQVNFMGNYRLCQQYQVGEPCKIGEAQCSFAHYPEEINLWRLDREDQININQFMIDQRNNILRGEISFNGGYAFCA